MGTEADGVGRNGGDSGEERTRAMITQIQQVNGKLIKQLGEFIDKHFPEPDPIPVVRAPWPE